MKLPLFSKKWVIVTLHILLWLLLFSLPYLLRPSYDSHEQHNEKPHSYAFQYLYFINCLTWVAIFYFNAYVLIKEFIYKKKYWQYGLLQAGIIIVLFLLNWLFFSLLVPDIRFEARNFFTFNIFPYLFILASSTAFKTILDRTAEEKQAKEKETENLKTELSFLRSQVSPHFMFNVLNNMVALARKQSDQLEPSLIKLSSLLRYMLYETDEEKVPLEKELEYLKSYIDLQQQRFGKKIKINVCLQEVDNSYTIEPMLLIPFVENAFKHGVGLIEDAQIDIQLSVQHKILQFFVRNKFNTVPTETKDKTSGIGLNNVKRRLNLLYRNNHSLLINKDDGWFTVSLQLNLH